MTDVQVKAVVRERDGHRCTECGMTNDQHVEQFGKSLHVHRVRPASAYTVDGCVTLCRRCHGPKPKLMPGGRIEHPRQQRMICFAPEVYELIVRMASDAGRPVNWEARRIAVLMARAAKVKGAESIPILPPVRD